MNTNISSRWWSWWTVTLIPLHQVKEFLARSCRLYIQHSDFSGDYLRDWLQSCLSQSANRTHHTLNIWGPLKTKNSWAACCCSWGPAVQQTEANTAWQPLPCGKGNSEACVQCSSFTGSCSRDWFLSQSMDGTEHTPDVWGLLRTEKTSAACFCSGGTPWYRRQSWYMFAVFLSGGREELWKMLPTF